jgi:hypothetical protein
MLCEGIRSKAGGHFTHKNRAANHLACDPVEDKIVILAKLG